MMHSREHDKKYRGLENLGNSCFLNSAFQALYSVKPFRDYFGSDAWTNHRHESVRGYELAGCTATLVQQLKEPGPPVRPTEFVRAFVSQAADFDDALRQNSRQQADAGEAIQILLDLLHCQQAREVKMSYTGKALTADQAEVVKSLESWTGFFRKEYSTLLDTFYGQTQKKIVCNACRTCSTSYEPWGVFKAPIPSGSVAGAPAPTFSECMAKALESETLDDFDCDTCKKKGPATIQLSISKFPKYMIVSLLRFVATGAKIRCRIPYDENAVSLAPYRSWPSIQKDPVYRVISTVEHLGGSRGGHYVMRTRETEDGAWRIFDDDRVSMSPMAGAATPDTYIMILQLVV